MGDFNLFQTGKLLGSKRRGSQRQQDQATGA
jgi:hypothetical protein